MPSYDAQFISDVLAFNEGYLFVGPDEIELLKSRVGHTVTIPVVHFPLPNNEDSKLVRWEFAGTLVTYAVNEAGTKGRFVFNDGTVVMLNTALLG